jgi:hypothetical protein
LFGDWNYVFAVVALSVVLASWRGGTASFLAEFQKSNPFFYPTFVLDMHTDLIKAIYLSAVHRRLEPALIVHAIALVAMWALIVTGPEWSK